MSTEIRGDLIMHQSTLVAETVKPAPRNHYAHLLLTVSVSPRVLRGEYLLRTPVTHCCRMSGFFDIVALLCSEVQPPITSGWGENLLLYSVLCWKTGDSMLVHIIADYLLWRISPLREVVQCMKLHLSDAEPVLTPVLLCQFAAGSLYWAVQLGLNDSAGTIIYHNVAPRRWRIKRVPIAGGASVFTLTYGCARVIGVNAGWRFRAMQFELRWQPLLIKVCSFVLVTCFTSGSCYCLLGKPDALAQKIPSDIPDVSPNCIVYIDTATWKPLSHTRALRQTTAPCASTSGDTELGSDC